MFFVCRSGCPNRNGILAESGLSAQTDDVSHSAGGSQSSGSSFFLSKNKKTTIRKGTIDSRCHRFGKETLFHLCRYDPAAAIKTAGRDDITSL